MTFQEAKLGFLKENLELSDFLFIQLAS